MGVGFFVIIWVARYLGPEQFGIYNYAIAFVALFSAIATLGLENIVVRNIVEDPESANEILGTAFILKIIGGVLALCLTIGIIFIVRPEDNLTRWMVGIIAFGMLFQAFDAIDFWFQSQVLSKYTVYAKNTSFLIASILKMGLILLHAPLIAFAWIVLAEFAMGAIGMVIVYRINGLYMLDFKVGFRQTRELLKDSWPLIFSGVFVLVNMQIDKVMIGEISGDIEVGIYSAASRLSELWYFIPVVVGASVAPVLVREKSRIDSVYHIQLQKTYSFMTMIALFCTIPITFFSKSIIYIIFGTDYSAASHILSVHIWSAIFVFHVSIRSKALIIEGLQNFIAVYAFFTMTSNVIFNLFLIPNHGGIGAAYASLLSWMLSVLFMPCFSRKTIKSVQMFFKSFNLFFLKAS